MKTDRDKKPQLFKPGQSGNPKGRPKGSRNAIQEDFLKDIHEAWKAHGKEVIASTVEEKPAEFLKVVASLLPKEAKLEIEDKRELSDIERAKRIEALLDSARARAARQAVISGDMGSAGGSADGSVKH